MTGTGSLHQGHLEQQSGSQACLRGCTATQLISITLCKAVTVTALTEARGGRVAGCRGEAVMLASWCRTPRTSSYTERGRPQPGLLPATPPLEDMLP